MGKIQRDDEADATISEEWKNAPDGRHGRIPLIFNPSF
jgi:hypothetical protein